MAGRRPLPTKLHKLHGNPGKRPLNTEEPQPRAGIPECPSHLDALAKEEWNRIVPELELSGLLSQVDRAALAAYCQSWSRWVDAEEKIQMTGPVIKTNKGYPIQNPYLGIANTALEHMRKFLIEFGMSPASRSKLRVTIKDSEEEDPLAEFLRPNTQQRGPN